MHVALDTTDGDIRTDNGRRRCGARLQGFLLPDRAAGNLFQGPDMTAVIGNIDVLLIDGQAGM
ncbi:MAG: hypothetical protein U5P41_03300 [Gammaproteobacteria bacterium]|nr:hypothetical protein [Gammaproteobacteria bacterium]